MKDFESKAVDLLNKIESITESYAPDVANAAVSAVRITAIGDMVAAFAGLMLTTVGAYFAYKLTSLFVRKKERDGILSDWELGYFLSGVAFIIIGVTGGFTFVSTITDIWVWVSMFNPELGLAHKISGL